MANQVSMVNTRGRVVWVEEGKVFELRDQGFRLIVNPKETYYPQYDQTIGKPKDDEIGVTTRVIDSDDFTNILGLVVL